MSREWLIALIAIAVIVFSAVVAISILLDHFSQQDNIELSQWGEWNVELWNLQYGFRIDLEFQNTTIVGRYTLFTPEMQMHRIQIDNCISREHVLLYDQGGMLWAWNLSSVNPAMINDSSLDTPYRILPGHA